MANKAMPRGMQPYERCIRSRVYVAGGTVYPGDTVALGSAGTVTSSITVPLIGVALNYAASGSNVLVADDPSQVFVVEANASVAAADVGQNASLSLGTASTAYKLSRLVLDQATLATTATLAVKILAIGEAIDNAAGSTNVDVVVKINNHALSSGTGTVGI